MNQATTVRGAIARFLRDVVSEVTQIDPARLREHEAFEHYGINSMMALQLTEALERRVPNLPRTLFFEHRTLAALTDYFEQHAASFFAAAPPAPPAPPAPAAAASDPLPLALPPLALDAGQDPLDLLGIRHGLPLPQPAPRGAGRASGALDIAIVGLAGRYPDANDLDTFWQNLLAERDSIREVPPQRWDHAAIYDADRQRTDKVYAKWGGFLDDVAGFDPLFFRISPKEAEGMDPQERLFLQTAWHAVEDAGYRPSTLAERRVGVFVGAMWSQYQLYGVEASARGELMATSSSFASIANRVSFAFDFEGPSLALDTMCSSSLTAIHLAAQSLALRECDAALAGGVNLTLHPNKYVHLSRNNFAASDGRCRAFGAGGDGYVPGEGVGCVVLKRLADAVADGDHIHGIIKGSAINHGGRTHGYTVPNPQAQARAVRAALQRAGCTPQALSYIEAHGTGTALGDPIELAGLQAVFGDARCAIGSVKSNIGHLEAAAGIAGLTKVLLQMRHRTLVASLHTATLNPHVDWASSTFTVQRERAAWRTPDGLPLRAGLSAFGAGGSNAHLVVEQAPEVAASAEANAPQAPQWLLLSARSEAQLRVSARRLSQWLEREGDTHALADVAYTLQVGREPMAYRAALCVATPAQAIAPLRAFAEGRDDALLFGAVHSSTLGDVLAGEAGDAFIAQLLAGGQWETLARLWCSGCEVRWSDLAWAGRSMRRVPLPGYPFASKPLWAATPSPVAGMLHGAAVAPPAAPLAAPALPAPGAVERWQTPGWSRPLALAADAGYGSEPILLLLPREPAPALQRWLDRGAAASAPFFTVTDDEGYEWRAGHGARCRLDDPAALRRLAAALAETPLAGVIDAADLGPARAAHAGRVHLLQRLIGERRAPLRLLHLSFGAAERSPAAAVLQGLHGVLPLEYSRVSATAATLDPSTDAAAFDAALRDAWVARSASMLDYTAAAAGGRRQRVLDELDRPGAAFEADPDKVYLVTGGTGGIGLALAQWLVQRGARKLALTGLRALPPRADWQALLADPATDAALLRRLRVLVALPCELKLHAGALSDRVATRSLVASLNDWGGIAGVFHAAGRVDTDTPAFVHKSSEQWAAVLEPKVEGAAVLMDALRTAPPAFLLLFSSVSSLHPELGVGLADYAAANHALNALAESAHARGDHWVRSVVWQNWAEVGLGEVKSERYARLGLLALSTAQGLSLLERALSPGLPAVVFPALVAAAAVTTPAPAPAPASGPAAATSTPFVETLRARLAPVLRLDAHEWPLDVAFGDLGVDSILIASLHQALEQWLGLAIDPGLFLEHPTLNQLALHLARHQGSAVAAAEPTPSASAAAAAAPAEPAPAARNRYAIVGMACRFPKAPNLATFRENLRSGVNAIVAVPPSRWDVAQHYDSDYQPGKSIGRWGGFVEDIERFDPAAFEIAPQIAEQVDPLIRLALEASVESLRDAGYTKDELKGRAIGVFLGSRVANYAERIQAYDRSSVIGVGQNFIAAHVSQLFDLTGPALVLDSACSSSLLAVHLACQSIASGECEAAIAGGVDVLLDERPYLMLTESRALSPTGLCRTFDDKADGFVPGEGAGAVVLKSLERALADGDRIYAVVEGSAVNNDGRTMGITTPNPQQQQAVIRAALARAGADAAGIGYIEAHGTGTRIGDPIELRGLTQVFRDDTDASGYCAIGSVKTNIGHLLSAAGIASVIKVALGIAHGELYPTLNCDTPNPRFAFQESPFYVNTGLRAWQPIEGVRRAGISSFGFGGTNVHAVLSDAHGQGPATTAPRRTALPGVAMARERHWLAARHEPVVPGAPAAPGTAALAPKAGAGFRFAKRG